ncbi:TssA family type VI secretion system protein [Thiotrichales bacterium 19S3-7]|nr:TssA family type VI secretion system protein [Thiotrichales bacterium 19S3-7]MCF6802136.1 TssA family type VI secretion system protein [Thiotrichales bacterium 19S3-11]
MDLDELKHSVFADFDQNKVGENCRDNERYTQIKDLLAQKNNPNADEASIHWSALSKLASEILTIESKDLLVACYLAIGLLNTNDLEGLTVGIEIINQMLEVYWPDLYPPLKRLNGRLSALVWLQEQLGEYLDNLQVQKPKDQVQPLLDSLTKFDEKLATLSDEAPNFLPVIKQFQQIIAPEEEPLVAEVETSHQMASQAEVFDIKAENITNLDDAYEQLKVILKAMANLADYFNGADANRIVYYRLSRLSLWQGINHLPEYDSQFKTKVPPPEKDQINQLEVLEAAANDQGVVDTCEEWVSDNPYWFDLHYSIYQALMNLGTFEKEANEIKIATHAVITRFPELLNLTFSNGMLMVSEAMNNWLNYSVTSNESTDVTNLTNHNEYSEIESQLLEALDNNKTQTKSKKLTELAGLIAYLSSDVNQSLKIRLIIAMIDQLIIAKKKTLLKSYTNLLEDKYHYFHVDQWDTKEASHILITLIRAKKMLEEDIAEPLMQLAQIDLDAAMKIKEN